MGIKPSLRSEEVGIGVGAGEGIEVGVEPGEGVVARMLEGEGVGDSVCVGVAEEDVVGLGDCVGVGVEGAGLLIVIQLVAAKMMTPMSDMLRNKRSLCILRPPLNLCGAKLSTLGLSIIYSLFGSGAIVEAPSTAGPLSEGNTSSRVYQGGR